MPKVDLGSTTNLLASPVQAQKGYARDVRPFTKVLSSLDAAGKRGQTISEPIGEPVETIANHQPPASQAEVASGDETRAADADHEAISAHNEPGQAQDCAPRDDAQTPGAAPEERDPSVERVLPDAKGARDLGQAEVTAIDGAATTQLAPAPPKDITTESAPAPGVSEPQTAEQGEQPAKATNEAAPEVKEVSAETRGESKQGQAGSPEARAGSSTVTTSAANGPEPAEIGVIAGRDSSGIVKGAASVVVKSKLEPAPQLAIDAITDPIDPANVGNVSETLQRRPVARTKAGNPPVIRTGLTSSDMGSTGELNSPQSQVSVQPATDQFKPDSQLPMDDHRQDASQKLPVDQPHQPMVLHHPTSPTSVPVGQVAAASTPPTPVSGNSQKSGVSNAIGSVAAPLSGAQVKQMALERLTAQAPLLKQGIEQASFIPQAAKGLAMALKQSDGTITLKLTPGHLGALKIEITLQGTEVAARLEPSTESARQLLIDSQSSLRAALEARGLSVERIEVTAPQNAPAQDARDQRNPGHHQDQSGAGFAGQGDAGRHTGRDAESFPGQQGKAIGRQFEASGETDEPRPMTQDPTITLALDNGGTYRLHLDAVA